MRPEYALICMQIYVLRHITDIVLCTHMNLGACRDIYWKYIYAPIYA